MGEKDNKFGCSFSCLVSSVDLCGSSVCILLFAFSLRRTKFIEFKISTIVLKVDLECQRCYKKIRRTLCKIQDKMNIKTISFDEKSNSVTISGPFDADKAADKGGKGENKDAGKAENKDAKPAAEKKEAAAAKAEKAEGKADNKAAENPKGDAGKPAKKVTFDDKPPKADIGPLLAKIAAAKNVGPAPPCGEPIAPAPVAAQGVAVPSIWPAPASSVAGYSYNPSYDPSSYYGGGGYAGGYGACGCGYGGGYCRCGKPAAPAAGGYYGVPVYDHQGWYYGGGGGGRQQPAYYPQQQQVYCEDPNAGCSVM
ncbi:hypothetical protein PR202_gb21581 [Eleusine coracana subsp. coracana]|uniref:Uncharacterized protein n=1 Tax=Eleusine coracana subsp. coracana TaxID=191504 RepID=A0AAV5FBG7_ELECO|nr:hypothetical protein PR202_gb21581 [Eleusine coracana subsp. coracana]